MNLTSRIGAKIEAHPEIQHRLSADKGALSHEGPGIAVPSPTAGGANGRRLEAFCYHVVASVAGLLLTTSAMVHASEGQSPTPAPTDWQISRLMAPTPNQLAAESKGQVFIYDSLDINQVEEAMDSNFSRIEHMMFIRIHHPPATDGGHYEVEDDDC